MNAGTVFGWVDELAILSRKTAAKGPKRGSILIRGRWPRRLINSVVVRQNRRDLTRENSENENENVLPKRFPNPPSYTARCVFRRIITNETVSLNERDLWTRVSVLSHVGHAGGFGIVRI